MIDVDWLVAWTIFTVGSGVFIGWLYTAGYYRHKEERRAITKEELK